MPDLSIPLLDPSEPVECPSCQWNGRWQDASLIIHDFCAKLNLSGRAPAGECPECGSVISFKRARPGIGEYGLAYTARKLLPLFYELHQLLGELREKGIMDEDSIGDDWPELSAKLDKITIQQHEALVAELRHLLAEQ